MTLDQAYKQCKQLAKQHYENFPVASVVLPAKIRRAVTVIYVFSRIADDIVDEGDATDEQRLQQLDDYQQQLTHCLNNESIEHFVFIALQDVIKQYALPHELFYDLLSAFKQDVDKQRYQDFGEVMHYCRRSANPVGRLLLHLFDQADEKNLALSDGICSALQLLNFYQDLSQDYNEMQRIYIPQQDLEQFDINESYFAEQKSDAAMLQLMHFEYARAEKLLSAGAWLGTRLKGRAGFEIRLIIAAGFKVLEKLKQQNNVFSRPRLSISDYAWIFLKALRKK